MQLRQPFVRKHVHTWKRSFLHGDDYGLSGFDIERECLDCGNKAHARITLAQKNDLPDSVLHLGDFDWRLGPL